MKHLQVANAGARTNLLILVSSPSRQLCDGLVPIRHHCRSLPHDETRHVLRRSPSDHKTVEAHSTQPRIPSAIGRP